MGTYTLAVPGVDLVYDVRGPLPPSGGHPALLMIGQPMTADGFDSLAAHFTDRTVVTYDPRGAAEAFDRAERMPVELRDPQPT
jgi:hypothetical protein